MALQQIDAKMLSKMFLAGAKNLENKKEWINELNVFPVPDGDTGTNMTMTIMSAAREVSALGEDADMAALCKAISLSLIHIFTGSFDVSGAGPLFSEPVPCQRRFSVFVFLCIYTDLSVCYDHNGIADLREY